MRNVRAKYAGICADSGCGRPYEVGHTIRRAWVCSHRDHNPTVAERVGPKPSPTVAEPEGQAVAEPRPNGPVVIDRPPEKLYGRVASSQVKAALKACGILCRTRMGRGTVGGKLSVEVDPWPGEPEIDKDDPQQVHGQRRPDGHHEWWNEQQKWERFVDLIASTAIGGTWRYDSDPGCDYQPLNDVSVSAQPHWEKGLLGQDWDAIRWDVEGVYVPSIDHGNREKNMNCTLGPEDIPQWPVN